MVIHRDSTSSHTHAMHQHLSCACVASCSSRSFLLGCLGSEMVLTLSASCTVSSSCSHSISSSSASPPTFSVRMSPSRAHDVFVHLPPATCLSAGSELGLTRVFAVKTCLCHAKSEQLSAFERLVGTQIHMPRMNMPPPFLSGMTPPVLRSTMRGLCFVRDLLPGVCQH